MEAKDSTFYQSCKLNKTPKMYGTFSGSLIYDNDMPDKPTPDEVVYYRVNPTLKSRARQIEINLLGLLGGRPYVDARLSRFAAENEIDWIGGKRPDGSSATGRLQQTHAFPFLGRINEKINQYVFSEEPEREGIEEAIEKDITRDGRGINDLMRDVSSYLFAAKWCWIGVDAPMGKDDGTPYTLAEREAAKIRPYWQVYNPLEVLDWHFSEKGELEWIKTHHMVYDDHDPATLPVSRRVVKLWQKGIVTEYELDTAKPQIAGRYPIKKTEYALTLTDRIPFVCVGNITDKPTAFDDLESINRTIMDLGSVDRANYFNCVYPQLVLPASVLENAISSGYANSATEAAKLVVGFKNPILVGENDSEPKYLMPDSSAVASVGERISVLKREMFEVVGLALEQDSRQVASAEAKAWDFLDVAAVMKARAEILEDAEKKAVEISEAWDADFKPWAPDYNRDFDVGDFKEEVSALVMAGNMPLPGSVTKEIVKKLVDRLDRLGTPIDAETKDRIFADIETWNPEDFGGAPAITV